MMQYLDFSHATSSTSRKWPHKRQPGQGFDAPRNSMEFAMDAPPRSYGVFQEDVPYTRNNMRQYPRASSAPVKKLIHEDISYLRPNEGHKRAPSVIARLMGMDSPPLSSATGQLIAAAHSDDRRRQEMIIAKPVTRRDPAEMISTKHVSFVEHKNPPARHAPKHEIRAFDDDDESKRSNGGGAGGDDDRWSKPVPREHPQEEELQKFKKEFEAWQASRVWEQSRTLELETRHGAVEDDDRRCSEIVPYRYHQQQQGYRGREGGGNGNGNGDGDQVHWRRRRSGKDGGASISGSRTFSVASGAGDDCSSRLPLSRFYREEEEEERSSPTRIVVLRPCPELSADDVSESSLVGSPELTKKENDMEAFLEEVRTRLKLELEGSSNHRASDAWAGGDMADPKRIARSIASQIRDTVVAMDAHHHNHPALVRSESTRSYRSSSDVQSQVDYICRDARRQLSDRLRNVLRTRESPEVATPDPEPPFFPHRRRPSFDEAPLVRKPKPPRREAARSGSKKKIRSKEEKKRAIESSDARHYGLQRNSYSRTSSAAVDSEDEDAAASPRNLMRSFSAPVSSRSSNSTFVKLLSDEPRVLFPGARVQRKHENGHGSRPAPAPEEEERPVKALGGIKGRVSSLRQNLGLRGKLFGKKLVHSSAAADESSSSSFFPDDLPPIGTLVTAPSVLIHPGVLQENSTEVPPSPASWCSSPADDMVRGGYPSPVSPLEASFGEHRSPLKPLPPATSSPASEEQGNPWLLEQEDQTEELAETSPALHDAADEDDTAEIEMDHHPVKAFIRAVLAAAGMFGGQNNDQMFFSNSQPKPIPKWVLDEVISSSSSSSPPAVSDIIVDRRLLFDMINEHLHEAGAARGSTTMYTFSKWYIAVEPRRGGKRLLDALWRAVQALLEPPPSHDGSALPTTTTTTTMMGSVDALIGRDMGASPWSGGVFPGDVDGVGEEVEAEILGELLDETLWDVLLNVGDD